MQIYIYIFFCPIISSPTDSGAFPSDDIIENSIALLLSLKEKKRKKCVCVHNPYVKNNLNGNCNSVQ